MSPFRNDGSGSAFRCVVTKRKLALQDRDICTNSIGLAN